MHMTLSTAGAFRNNCGLHCLAHLWMQRLSAMKQEDVEALVHDKPIYNAILNEANMHYKCNLKNFSELLSLDSTFPHPLDREIFWGPVLRNTLIRMLPKEEKGLLEDYKIIDEQLLAKLANAMGISLVFHIRIKNDKGEEEIVPLEPAYPGENELMIINLYHTQKGGGHYDFSFGDEFADTLFNSQFRVDADNRRHPIGGSWFNTAINTIGVFDQDSLIRNQLHNQMYLANHNQDTYIEQAPLRKKIRLDPDSTTYKGGKQPASIITSKYEDEFHIIQKTCERFSIPSEKIPQLFRHLESMIQNICELGDLDEDERSLLISSSTQSLNQEICHCVENVDLMINSLLLENNNADMSAERTRAINDEIDDITLASRTTKYKI
jgi:hypothetical protein